MFIKSNSPKISIIVPSLNKALYIEKTLQSIVSQNYSNYEVIIQDGGSTDGTLDIIKKYARRNPKNISWECKDDGGQKNAINEGLKKAKGDIVCFINADDIYLNNSFKKISLAYQNNPNNLWFVGKGVIINEGGTEIESSIYKFIIKPYKDWLLKINNKTFLQCVNYIMQPSVFINKRVLNSFLFTGETSYVMEYQKWLELANREMPYVVNENLSGFRFSNNSLTFTKTKEILNEDQKLIKKFTKNPFVLIIHFVNNIGRYAISLLV